MSTPQVADSRYPLVQQAMDPRVVQGLLNQRLAAANRAVRFEEVSVDYSFYVPGHNFRIVYRGEIVNGTSRATQLFSVVMRSVARRVVSMDPKTSLRAWLSLSRRSRRSLPAALSRLRMIS